MFLLDGKPLDLTKPQADLSIQLKPGGSITQSKNGLTQRVANDTKKTKTLYELVKNLEAK